MKTLLILRHAKSSRDNPDIKDHERPLNNRGLKDAKRLGNVLSAESLMPDFILTSTAKRAQDTASLVAEHSGYKGELKSTQEIYEAEIEDLIALAQKTSNSISALMIVGHNPTLEQWVNLLADAYQPLTTANLAKIELPIKKWEQLSLETKGQLVKIWRPKEESKIQAID